MEVHLLTEASIFDKVDELKVAQYYFGNIEYGKKVPSLIRDDNNPSFSFFQSNRGTNKVMWKDWGTGESGNILKLLMKVYNLTYPETLDQIYNDIEKIETCEPFTIVRGGARKKITKDTILNVAFTDWTQEHTDYWAQYEITPEMCGYYDIHAISNVYLTNSQYTNKCVWYLTKGNPMFAYVLWDDEGKFYYKLYRPLVKGNWSKWLSNCPHYLWQGAKQLVNERGELCFITKSLKDVIALRAAGFYSVAPHSENNELSEGWINWLYDRFDNVIQFYDNDEAGINAMTRNYEKHGLSYISLEHQYNAKDPSDFSKIYGIKNLTEYVWELVEGK